MAEPKLQTVRGEFNVCSACLDGEGGECHTPGCLFWINRAPDIPLRGTLAEVFGCTIEAAEVAATRPSELAELRFKFETAKRIAAEWLTQAQALTKRVEQLQTALVVIRDTAQAAKGTCKEGALFAAIESRARRALGQS